MSSVQFNLKNSTKEEWTAANPILARGEPGVEYDTGQMKVGNGADTWANLRYVSAGELADIVPYNSLITSTQWLTGGNSANSASVFTSGDGQSWNSSGSIQSKGSYVYTLVWNGFQWLLGSNSNAGPAISTSPDGITWTGATNDVFYGGVCYGIGYNGSQYVAVGKNNTGDLTSTSTVALSLDGKNWTAASVDPFAGASGGIGFGVCWDGSQWIAVGTNVDVSLAGQSTSTLATSPDGVTWTNISSGDPFIGGAAYSIAYNGSQYVVAGTNGGSLFYSGAAGTMTLAATNKGQSFSTVGDGVASNLQLVTNDPFGSGNAYGVAWNGQTWLAVGTNIGNNVTGVTMAVTTALSTDGFNWTPSSPFGIGIGYGVSWSGNKWVLSGTNVAPYSTDVPTITNVSSQNGVNWEVGTNAVSADSNSVQYCVAVKNNLAGVSIPKTVASGILGDLQYTDGNGNFNSNHELFLSGGGGTELVLNTPILAPTSIKDSNGSIGTAGQVLASDGIGLQWQTSSGGGGGTVSGLSTISDNLLVVSDGVGGVKSIGASLGGNAGFLADQGAGPILNVPAFSFQNTTVYDTHNAVGVSGQVLTARENGFAEWANPISPSGSSGGVAGLSDLPSNAIIISDGAGGVTGAKNSDQVYAKFISDGSGGDALNVPTLSLLNTQVRDTTDSAGVSGQVLTANADGHVEWTTPATSSGSGGLPTGMTYDTNGLQIETPSLIMGNEGDSFSNIFITSSASSVSTNIIKSIVLLNSNSTAPSNFIGGLPQNGFFVSPLRNFASTTNPTSVTSGTGTFFPLYYNPTTGEIACWSQTVE